MEALFVVTGNAGKIAELARMLEPKWRVEGKRLPIDEIQSLSVEEVVRDKAARAFEILRKPLLVDDSGLEIADLNGLPGALVTWFFERLGPAGVAALIPPGGSRRAKAVTALGYADEAGVTAFTGMVDGAISGQPRGEGGFGFDPIFIPDGGQATFAEMSGEEKDRRSPRFLAVMQLRRFLEASAG